VTAFATTLFGLVHATLLAQQAESSAKKLFESLDHDGDGVISR